MVIYPSKEYSTVLNNTRNYWKEGTISIRSLAAGSSTETDTVATTVDGIDDLIGSRTLYQITGDTVMLIKYSTCQKPAECHCHFHFLTLHLLHLFLGMKWLHLQGVRLTPLGIYHEMEMGWNGMVEIVEIVWNGMGMAWKCVRFLACAISHAENLMRYGTEIS